MAMMPKFLAHPCLERRYPYQAFCQSIGPRPLPLNRVPIGFLSTLLRRLSRINC